MTDAHNAPHTTNHAPHLHIPQTPEEQIDHLVTLANRFDRLAKQFRREARVLKEIARERQKDYAETVIESSKVVAAMDLHRQESP